MKKIFLLLAVCLPALVAFGQTPNYGTGFTSSGLTLNGGAAINGTRLRVTDGGKDEARSAFFNTPVSVANFSNTFTFQDMSASADGLCFVIEASGPTAVGGDGGNLGYAGTSGALSTKSLCVSFDLYNNLTYSEISNTGLFTNGASPAGGAGSAAGSLSFQSGDVMSVQMNYNGTTLTMQITDTVTDATYSTSFTVNIPSVVGGSTAYVGFTGGTGGLTAIQDILTWTYTTGQQAATPTITPGSGTETSPVTVTLTDTTPSATITYTTDGTTPVPGSHGTAISSGGSFQVSFTSTATIEAVASATGFTPSAVAIANYTTQSSGGSPSYGSGFTAAGLTLNGGAAINGTRLRVTDGGKSEARSAFFSTLVNVTNFTNTFTFQDTSASADGLCFVIEASGPTALGLGGGNLGYAGTTGALSTESLCVAFDLYNNVTYSEISNTGLFIDGASPAGGAGSAAGSLSFQSGDVMSVQMTYNGATLTMQITDTVTNAKYNTSFTANIPSVVGGSTAYVGFTGGTGGLTAIQDILTWTYTSGTVQQQAATPTITPGSGTETSPVTVTLTDTTPSATITYTTDGTTPVPGSHGTAISSGGSFQVSFTSTATVEAIASASGFMNSATAIVTYTIQSSGGGTPEYGSGFTSTGLTLNGGATISGTKLQLTDGGSGEARSVFFDTPVNVQSFITDFTFQLINANADGFTFTIQNNSLAALGVGGGSLGYGPNSSSTGGIPNSIAVKFDLYSNAGEGSDSTGLYADGASPTIPAIDMTSSGVNLHSGDTMAAHLAYDGTTLTLIITDTSTHASFGTTFTVNIPATVGADTAYVGFTGGTGGLTATQDVLTWTYNPVPVTAFAWPVNTPIVLQTGSSGGANDFSTYDGPEPIFGSYHTGIDVCPQSPGCAVGNAVYATSSGIVELALVVSDPTETLCGGGSTAGYKINPSTSNLGNVIVIAHPNGKFSLYGHLDCIWPGIVPGLQVSAGTQIGQMGHSEFGERMGSFAPHTHFEMKDRAVTGDPTNEGYSGYVPDLPDGYGYHDARIWINPFTPSSLSPTAVKNVGTSPLNVFTGPATSFAFLTSVGPAQEFVAFATSGSWYQIYLPNDNAPVSGWIQGGSGNATPDSTATQIQVTGTGGAGLLIRPGASGSSNLTSWDETFFDCNPSAKIWDGQRYVTTTNQSGWYEFYLPVNYYFSSSNTCQQPSGPGPNVGWASGTFLTVIP
jgi:murein DD-endopeptidase MepM/ murein hydrolase activator NlpD